MENVMDDIKGNVRKWVKELRSGKYKQAEGQLQDGPRSFCCLGVACLAFIPEDKIEFNVDDDTGESGDLMQGELPCEQTHAPLWLHQIDDDFQKRTGMALSSLNDGFNIENPGAEYYSKPETKARLTFDEIADLLELVYIEEVEML